MSVDLKSKVSDYSKKHSLLSPGDRVLVALSGGPDSVALLHVLYELRDDFSLRLEVAHLQHGIRGAEAKEDAQFVRDLANSLGLPFHLKEIDLPRLKSETGRGNLEALARKERYRFFAALLRERQLTKVEALRQAQLQLIQGKTNSDLLARRGIGGVGKLGETPEGRSLSPDSVSSPLTVTTSHPYFWAPFILVGEGK